MKHLDKLLKAKYKVEFYRNVSHTVSVVVKDKQGHTRVYTEHKLPWQACRYACKVLELK